MENKAAISRRGFVGMAGAAAAISIVPRHAVAGSGRTSPNEKLNIAGIGVGGMMPPRPEELEEGRRMGDSDGGVLFLGDKGALMCGCYGRSPRLVPETRMQQYKQPAHTIPRIPGGQGGHEKDWVRACKDGKPASSNFDFSGPLSEMVLMGNLAVRFPDRRLLWDGEKMQVTNDAAANAYVRRQYRRGWELE